MEEILASIRRIISDDRILPVGPNANTASPDAAGPRAEIAPPTSFVQKADESRPEAPRLGGQRRGDLDEEARRPAAADVRALRVLSATSDAPEPANSQTDDDSAMREFEDNFGVEPMDPLDAPIEAIFESLDNEEPQAPAFGESILSPATDASVASSFQSLTASVLLQNSGFVEQSIRDMLRPLLKQWLDENLPSIVERLVRSEIERVARGGRR